MNNTPKSTAGDALSIVLDVHGLSDTEAGLILDKDATTVGRWKSGKTPLPLDKYFLALQKLADHGVNTFVYRHGESSSEMHGAA